MVLMSADRNGSENINGYSQCSVFSSIFHNFSQFLKPKRHKNFEKWFERVLTVPGRVATSLLLCVACSDSIKNHCRRTPKNIILARASSRKAAAAAAFIASYCVGVARWLQATGMYEPPRVCSRQASGRSPPLLWCGCVRLFTSSASSLNTWWYRRPFSLEFRGCSRLCI